MSVIVTGNHPKVLWPGVKAWFGAVFDKHVEQYSKVFEVVNSTKNYEEFVQMTGFGLAPVKDQGDGVSYTSHTQGWVKRFVHVVYGLGYKVTREEREDNQYSEVSNARAAAVAFALRQTKENVHANIFNRATSGSYLGGDGVALLSTGHPKNGGGTFSNKLSTASDMSQQSLEDLTIQVMAAEDDKGNKISLMPQQLLIPPQLVYEASRILKSTLQSDTAENATNVLKGVFPGGIVVNNYLTDTDQYFITTNAPRGLYSIQRRAVEFTKDNEFSTENALAKGTERYSAGWVEPRCVYGSEGA